MLLYIGTWGIKRSHYTLPMFPFIAMFAAYSTYYIYKHFNLEKKYLVILIVLLSISPITKSSIEILKRNRLDARLVAGNWIEDNIGYNANIKMNGELTENFLGVNAVF